MEDMKEDTAKFAMATGVDGSELERDVSIRESRNVGERDACGKHNVGMMEAITSGDMGKAAKMSR